MKKYFKKLLKSFVNKYNFWCCNHDWKYSHYTSSSSEESVYICTKCKWQMYVDNCGHETITYEKPNYPNL